VAQFDVAALATASDGFTGAEIEQAVVSSCYSAQSEDATIGTQHVLAEINATRPLSVVMAEDIQRLRDWARERTVSAS
jgi:cytidine deaminase